MAANTTPIYSRIADIQFNPLVLTGNTTTTLGAGTIYLLFTADPTNGGRVERVIIMPLGTNAATVFRLWINNGGVTTTATNNTQIRDITIPATTVNQAAAIGSIESILNVVLPPAYTLYATLGTTVLAGFAVTVFGGKY